MNEYPLDKILLPMNAKEVKDERKMDALWDDPSYIVEEKYDGSRYLSIGGRFFSRRISDVTGYPVEKTDNVTHLASILQKYHNLILDGEIYYPGMTSNEVTSIMGSLPERAAELQKVRGYLIYVVFDILRDVDGTWLIDNTWSERRKRLVELFNESYFRTFDTYVQCSTVVTDNKLEFYDKVIENGGEGVMLKNVNAKYIPDKRPAWNWVKVKKHITDDVVIVGFKPPVKEYEGKELDTWQYWEDGEGQKQEIIYTRPGASNKELISFGFTPVTKLYYHSWIGAVTFGKYDKDNNLVELGFCSGLTDELRKDMSENPNKYIGQVIEIGAMEKTKDGFYRHPRFLRLRPDKNKSECRIGE